MQIRTVSGCLLPNFNYYPVLFPEITLPYILTKFQYRYPTAVATYTLSSFPGVGFHSWFLLNRFNLKPNLGFTFLSLSLSSSLIFKDFVYKNNRVCNQSLYIHKVFKVFQATFCDACLLCFWLMLNPIRTFPTWCVQFTRFFYHQTGIHRYCRTYNYTIPPLPPNTEPLSWLTHFQIFACSCAHTKGGYIHGGFPGSMYVDLLCCSWNTPKSVAKNFSSPTRVFFRWYQLGPADRTDGSSFERIHLLPFPGCPHTFGADQWRGDRMYAIPGKTTHWESIRHVPGGDDAVQKQKRTFWKFPRSRSCFLSSVLLTLVLFSTLWPHHVYPGLLLQFHIYILCKWGKRTDKKKLYTQPWFCA